MTIIVGVDFRATAGFVTEPNGNYTKDLLDGTITYPVSFGTTTIGWEDTNVSVTRDRNAGNNARIAGMASATTVASYRIDLPSAGTYSIQVAVGEASYARSNQKLEIFDDASSILILSGNTGASNSFIAADNNVYTAANWVAANTVNGGGAAQVNVTFSSTSNGSGGPIARFKIGDGSNTTYMAHVFITGPTGGGGGAYTPYNPWALRMPVLAQ